MTLTPVFAMDSLQSVANASVKLMQEIAYA